MPIKKVEGISPHARPRVRRETGVGLVVRRHTEEHIRSPRMAFSLLPLRQSRHLRQFGGAEASNSPFDLATVATLATVRGSLPGSVAAVASVASWFKEMLLACLTARVARGRSTGRVPHRESGL
jgi:hypothetical protein